MADELLDAGKIVERLCKLQEEVRAFLNDDLPADCFCGEGGFWSSYPDDYGPTHEQGYRNAGSCVEFIEQAVREKIASKGASSSAIR